MRDSDLYPKWNEVAAKRLVGRKVVDARYMTREEADNVGFHRAPVVLVFDDGSYVFPSQDDEGNDAGALFGTGKEGGDDFVLPVL